MLIVPLRIRAVPGTHNGIVSDGKKLPRHMPDVLRVKIQILSIDTSLLYIYSVNMKKLIFEWDNRKDTTNLRKHGVSFEDAQTVFFDENAIEFDDPDHSPHEERFLLLGLSQNLKVLVVCHCYRENESIIRIISARKATMKEQKVYFRRS